MMVIVHDLLVVVLTWILLRWLAGLAGAPPADFLLRELAIVVMIQAAVFWRVGLYRGVWRFASVPDLINLAGAAFIGMLLIVVVLMVAGMLVLATMPVVAVVVVVQAVRRMGTYAISRPAREMLFTAVDRETRFKAKPVIDIVIYRGGDMLNAWAFTALTQGLGLGLASVAVVGAGVAALWAATGVYLGRRFNTMQEEETAVNSTAEVK